jgi:hypothetical protein
MREHGLSGHREYATWANMMARCYTSDCPRYPAYGGRGIEVCARWHDPRNFLEDITTILGPRPLGHSLDRIDNDGNYEPGNVQWATPMRQVRNRRITPSCQYMGVSRNGTWRARITVNGQRHYLGRYASAEDAARAYDLAAIKAFGPNAPINFPDLLTGTGGRW